MKETINLFGKEINYSYEYINDMEIKITYNYQDREYSFVCKANSRQTYKDEIEENMKVMRLVLG